MVPRYGLSYRDVEELLAERGIAVDYVTVYRWVQRFTPLLIDATRPCRHAIGDRWFVDETYAKVAGRRVYLYRAIDQFGQVIDVLVSPEAGPGGHPAIFHSRLGHGPSPMEVTTDHAAAYPRVLDELLPAARHVIRTIRKQPDRIRSRTAKIPTASHARAQTTPLRASNHRRARLHLKHPPRPLRTCSQRNSMPTGSGCLRRVGQGDLTNLDLRFLPVLTARNATTPNRVQPPLRLMAKAPTVFNRVNWQN